MPTNFNYEPRHGYDDIRPKAGRHRIGAVTIDAAASGYDDISKPVARHGASIAEAPSGYDDISQTVRRYRPRVRTGSEATHRPKAEYGANTPEVFIAPENARHLVAMVMEDRVDPMTGQLLPLEEERTLMGGPDYMMKPLPSRLRYDLVLPEEPRTQPYRDGGTLDIRQNYSIEGKIYDGLTNEHEINLGAADIERLTYEQAKLEQTLAGRPDLAWVLSKEQQQDAYHISQNDKPAPNSDGRLLSPVRVYVPGGVRGVEITNRMLEAGADFARAKVWVPQAARGEQSFRQDTPIFTANTADQLHSIVNALRSVAAQGLLQTEVDSPVGITIDGVPGAFIAQPIDQSFNGEMADFWSEPIREACNSLPLRAGQVVTSEWVREAAHRASSIAKRRARAAGINPAHHALVHGQDMHVILDAVRL